MSSNRSGKGHKRKQHSNKNGGGRTTVAATSAITAPPPSVAVLDENVTVQEFVLAHLVKRQALLAKQRQGMERNLLGLKINLKDQLFKERSLELAQTQQVQLQSELQSVMRKNKDKIRGLFSEDMESIELQDTNTVGVGGNAGIVEEQQQSEQRSTDGSGDEPKKRSEEQEIATEQDEHCDDGEMMTETEQGSNDEDDEDKRDNERVDDTKTEDDGGEASKAVDSNPEANTKQSNNCKLEAKERRASKDELKEDGEACQEGVEASKVAKSNSAANINKKKKEDKLELKKRLALREQEALNQKKQSYPNSEVLSALICENPFTGGEKGDNITALFAGLHAPKLQKQVSSDSINDNITALLAGLQAPTRQMQVSSDSILHSTRLHLLVKGKRLTQIMDLITLDQAAMDEDHPDGRHRRESLYHTCCCLMRPAWEQFTASKGGTSKDATTTTKTNVSADETAAWSMDPNTSLCPYELAGECADPYCPFQHLKPRNVESQALVLELLPLPPLKLVTSLLMDSTAATMTTINTTTTTTSTVAPAPTTTKITLQDERQDDNNEVEDGEKDNDKEDTEPVSKRQKVSDSMFPVKEVSTDQSKQQEESKYMIDQSSQEDALATPLDFNDDFLSLPAADDHEAGIDSNDEDEDEDENDDDAEDQQLTILWWMTGDDQERIRKGHQLQSPTSVSDWLQSVFELDTFADSTSLVYLARPTSSPHDRVRRLGRLVDALQLVLHAGRYDCGSAICDLLVQLCQGKRWVVLQNFFSNTLPQQWKMVNRFQQQNLFAGALEQQVLLSSISEVLRFMSQGEDSDSAKKKILAELLSRIVRLPCSAEKPGRSNESNVFLRRIKTLHPDLLPLVEVFVVMQKWYNTDQPTPTDQEGTKDMDQLDDLQKIAQNCSGRMATFQAIVRIGIFAMTAVQTMVCKEGATQKSASRLESKLDNICSWIDEPFNQPHLRMMLTPILAVRVSLLISLRRYDRAQRALERYLIDNPNNDKLGVMSFADLLWSQLVTLRSTLPCRRQDARNLHNGSATTQLSRIVTRLGVRLNHLALVGDRSLFQPFLNCLPCQQDKQGIKKWRGNLRVTISFFLSRATKLHYQSPNASLADMKLNLDSMPLTAIKYPGKILSLERLAFPRTLMLGGSCVKHLSLASCRIEELPPTFGDYFPNLQELTINDNRLTALPSSFQNLTALVRLDASNNKLIALPEKIGECSEIEHLVISNNQLTSLPTDIRRCSKLQRIDLSDNRFDKTPNDLVVHFQCLVSLGMQGNPCTD